MTDNEINVTLAKACSSVAYLNEEGEWILKGFHVARRFDPINDMNAMHEVENTLEIGFDGSQADDYEQCLWQIVNPGIEFTPKTLHDVAYLWNLMHATARQRAEAFLCTIGKT